MKCPNCRKTIDDDAAYCSKCGANVKRRRYSRDDDPLERIEAVEEKLDRLLAAVEDEDDDEEDDDDAEEESDRRKTARKAKRSGTATDKGKRRPLFGR